MITLGVYRGAGEHAAVVVDDGVVVSAVHASGEAERAAMSPGVERALTLAGVGLDQVTVLSTSPLEDLPNARIVSSELARAAQVRAVAPEARRAIVVDDGPEARESVVDLECLEARPLGGGGSLLGEARSVARALGLDCARPIAALETIALPAASSATAAAFLDELAAHGLTPAAIAASPHVEIQRLRAQAGTAALEGLVTALARAAAQAAADCPTGTVAFAGSIFDTPEFVDRLRRRIDIPVAAVPERFGEALGAALLPHRDVHPLRHLSLGTAFSESDIKAALENCRLDYVYETDWSRLYTRVSELLATGALVGWYQGRADFSRQSFGSRSILCDPSHRYSRENVNVFLLNRSVHTPVPLSVEAMDSEVSNDMLRPLAYTTARPTAPAAQRLSSAIDRHGQVRCHVADRHDSPEFHALLRRHRERTQVPGLLNVPMLAGGVLAPTPRDAIRECYGSATDALVIGRFLVAKDYWLLRSRSATPTSSRL